MGKGYRIRATEISTTSSKIRATDSMESKICFNFKSLQEKNGKFLYESRDSKYFVKLIDRLRDLSRWTRRELQNNHSKSLRCHQIDFKQEGLTEKTFGIRGDDVDDDAWQLTISEHEHGRIHGYFIENVFYIVWLDPLHELYSSY